MAKALVTITDIAWDSTHGFQSDLTYAVSGVTAAANRTFAVFAGISTALSQPDSYYAAIRAAVISDANTQFSVTLADDDIVIL